ncbi:MAG TPA: lysylphosphatidylglycerol synthase transmembrane domain-containing protein [Noviherbaspirillum sp.]|nr:lysylphosphatidylglycerol synthase transmembrane domain-containing protein [Noviherbaspirillum sp.]
MQRSTLVFYLLGLLLLSGLVGTILRFGELEQFLNLARHVEPFWLISGLVLQSGTYLCEALSWKLVLRRLACPRPLSELIPLSIAKLFSDQAMPSVGISGNAFLLTALRHRGIEKTLATSCMLVDLVTYFSSYALMAVVSLLVLAGHNEANRWLLTLTTIFVAIQASVPLAVWHLHLHGTLPGESLLRKFPRLYAWVQTLRKVPVSLLLQPGMFAQQLALHAIIVFLDAGSLWMMLRGIGQHLAFPFAFSSFVTASVVVSLSPIPLGLGTFEATCVAMLHVSGIGLEAGLAAVVLLRGLTVWLPMLPGLWLIRREMRNNAPFSA